MRLALVVVLLAGCGLKVRPQRSTEVAVDCGRGKGFDYCVYTPPPVEGRRSRDLLYYMHGGGESAESFGRWAVGKEYFKQYREKGLPAPRVAAVSFGRLWLLTEKGRAPASGLFERFVNEAMPLVEKKTGPPERRFLWGVSMGGFNSLELLLKRPELWKAAVLSCPGIAPFSPRAAPQEIADYMARSGAEKAKVDWLIDLARPYFPDAETWERHDPLVLAAAAGPLPAVLLECGDKDEYGFFEGARRLSDVLSGAGKSVEFHRVAGGKHCAVTPPVILKFLQAAQAQVD